MAQPFPGHPYLEGAFAPIGMECDAPDLVVEGEIPRELRGVLFRNGSNPQFAPRGGYHWFGGDGMIHAFRIDGGRVSYRNRYVRTVKWTLENRAGRALVNVFDPRSNDESVQGVEMDGLANTNIVWHAGRLLALEEVHAPFELDPRTLDSLGPCDFDGKLAGPMTAHPKVDPATGEMLFFGYNAGGGISERISFHVADERGRLVRSETFEAPYASMVHDFAVTREHIVFPVMPLTGSVERYSQGGSLYAWEPEKDVFVGVMPRDGSVADLRWFRGDPAYAFHTMNAHTDGNEVVCDVCQYERAPTFPLADGTPDDPDAEAARLTRWTFDLGRDGSGYRTERLCDLPSEFPRLDERRTASAYRYGYMACDVRPEPKTGVDAFNGIARIDHETGGLEVCDLGESCAAGEPVFVPRAADAPEGDGFLLAVVYDARPKASHLAILDARNVSAGPLARAFLDHRVPLGFHGNWAPAE